MRQIKLLAKYAMDIALLYLWLLQGIEMAGNVFKFYSYIILLTGIAMAFSDSMQKDVRERGAAFPVWVWSSFYTAIVFALAAFGYFWYAAIWLFAAGGYYIALNSKESGADEPTEAPV